MSDEVREAIWTDDRSVSTVAVANNAEGAPTSLCSIDKTGACAVAMASLRVDRAGVAGTTPRPRTGGEPPCPTTTRLHPDAVPCGYS